MRKAIITFAIYSFIIASLLVAILGLKPDIVDIERYCPAIINPNHSVAFGEAHTAFVKSDGTLWLYGNNEYGQLGNGTSESLNSPEQIQGFTEVISVAAGEDHTIALKKDGTVWAWGNNSRGQLGNVSIQYSLSPIMVSNLTDVKEIASGSYFNVALKSDGTVWVWGYNEEGMLFSEKTEDILLPIKMDKLPKVKFIDISSDFIFAFAEDNEVYIWGRDRFFSVHAVVFKPGRLEGLKDIIQIKLFDGNMYALTKSGRVWRASYYKFPIEDRLETVVYSFNEIVEIAQLDDVIQIESGTSQLLFLKRDGTIWGIGSDYYDQFGMEDYDDIPKECKSITGAKRIEANYDQSAAIHNNDSVDIWGKDNNTKFNLNK